MKTKLLAYIIIVLVIFPLTSCEHKSGRKNKQLHTQNSPIDQTNPTIHSLQGKTIVRLKKQNGVYCLPCEINGIKMEFIFDTGAGLISISATEAIFLYKQGKLKDEDFLGTANFIDANGDISEGTIVVFKSVKIGDRTINNIEASVVHNLDAPLLLGQSALERFGRVSIDYNRNEIIFE